VITLGPRETDNIYCIITITGYFYRVIYYHLHLVNGNFEI
jgi:hypothetical protein